MILRSFLILVSKPTPVVLFFFGCLAATSYAQTNPYAPRPPAKVKPPKEQRENTRTEVQRDTVPRFGKGRVDLMGSVAFPVQYFAEADQGNPDAGYASQGFGIALGRFLPFRPTGPWGVYLSAGYTSLGATGFTTRLQSVLDAYGEEEGDVFMLGSEYRPRYQLIPVSMGLAYEGHGKKADVYARFMLHGAFVGMNNFEVRGEESGLSVVNVGRKFSTGLGMELGARLNDVLRVGVAWKYFGRPELSYSIERGRLPRAAFAPLTEGRPVSLLEVKLGYVIDRSAQQRKGARLK